MEKQENKATTALIDGDIVVYRVGYTTMEEPVGIAVARLHTMLEAILADCESDAGYKVFLTPTDHSNFRFKIYPEYKAGRPDKKPTWYQELRAILLEDYGAELATGMEADDLLGIHQTSDTVLCTIDKDLDQIPGAHYDFVKEAAYNITPEHALRFFYLQLLTGDRVDNIPGCKGIGPKKADIILTGLETEEEYQQSVLDAYIDCYKGLGFKKMVQFGQVLKIKQFQNEGLWLPKYLRQETL